MVNGLGSSSVEAEVTPAEPLAEVGGRFNRLLAGVAAYDLPDEGARPGHATPTPSGDGRQERGHTAHVGDSMTGTK